MGDDNPVKVLIVDETSEDRLSQLPRDLIVKILSLLALDEAARTSVLSRKWKHLWNYTTVLDFDAWDVLMDITNESMESGRSWYICWVNGVLYSHRAINIDKFRINFDLDVSYESDINRWVNIAISKRVKSFELSFHPQIHWETPPELYTFPQKLFRSLQSDVGLSNVRSLRSLTFDSVNITGEMLEFFIYNCPHLEELSVQCSQLLLELKVVGSELQLKHLDICVCDHLEELEVTCPSLLSFNYSGPLIKCSIANVPRIQEVSLGGDVCNHWLGNGRFPGPFMNYFPKLKTLELFVELSEEILQFPKCELPALRDLTVVISAHHCSSFLDLTCRLKSCPFLQKLTVKMDVLQYSSEVISRHEFPKCSYLHLKKVVMVGFSGNPVELELAHYLLENAPTLDELLVVPWQGESEETVEAARETAGKLEEVVPPRVKFHFSIDLP